MTAKLEPPNPKPQSDKFKDMARELEADEDPEHFEKAVKKVSEAPRGPEKRRGRRP